MNSKRHLRRRNSRRLHESKSYQDRVLEEQLKILLENQTAHARSQGVRLDEHQSTTGAFSGIAKNAGMIVKRAFPKMIGRDIVGVQPMTAPTGQIFTLRHTYAGNSEYNTNPQGGGNLDFDDFSTGSNYTPLDNVRQSAVDTIVLEWDTTSNRQTDAPDTPANGDQNAGTGALSGLANVLYTERTRALVQTDGVTTIQDLKDLKGTGNIVDYNENRAGWKYIFTDYSGPVETLTGEGLDMTMQELGISIETTGIKAKTRKLKARYTLESLQDIQSYHGIDLDEELQNILSYELGQCVDWVIIISVNSLALTSYFDLGKADGRYWKERHERLLLEIGRKANEITQTTMKSPGNKIIASPGVVSALEYSVNGIEHGSIAGNIGAISYVGKLNNRFDVYMDAFATSDYVTIAYKGVSELDAGVIYAPYIPIEMVRTVDQESGNPNIILSERSAIASNVIASDLYYRKISVSNLYGEKASSDFA